MFEIRMMIMMGAPDKYDFESLNKKVAKYRVYHSASTLADKKGMQYHLNHGGKITCLQYFCCNGPRGNFFSGQYRNKTLPFPALGWCLP